jgi:hypothetical protein
MDKTLSDRLIVNVRKKEDSIQSSELVTTKLTYDEHNPLV